MTNSCFFFLLFLIMIFDVFMYPLRHQKKGRRKAESIFLRLLLCLFVNLVRSSFFFLYRAHSILTTAIPTSSSPLSHHYTFSIVLEQIERHLYVYIHDIIDHLFFLSFFFFYSIVLVNELLAINIESMNVSFSNHRKCLL